jgi:hypothetical protein
MSEKPPWRVAIEQFERSIGAPMEDFVKSDQFADMAAKAAKGQSEVQRELLSSTTEWLHSMNLPTATDIAELRAEIAELRTEVRALAGTSRPGVAEQKPPARSKAEPKSAAPAKPEPKSAAPAKAEAKSAAPAKPEPKSAARAKPKPKPKPKSAVRSKPKRKPE